jgi:hypothetical protein
MQAEIPNPNSSLNGQLREDHQDSLDSNGGSVDRDRIQKPIQKTRKVSVSSGNSRSIPPISEDLASVEHRLGVRRAKRHGMIEAFQDWFGCVVGTIVGTVLVSSGALELLYPDFLPLAYNQPLHLIAVGVLLTGSRHVFSKIKHFMDFYSRSKVLENEYRNRS